MLPICIDFETAAIEARPSYPPEPVGVAILLPGRVPRYYAWGHPEGNNCTKEEATEVLKDIFESWNPLLFHHAKFDLAVANEWLGLPVPSWDRIHDSMFLLFLADPYSLTLALKPAAERLLGLPPDEQDAVRDWLINHSIVKKGAKNFGAFISKAPGNVVAPYAKGDVDRTLKLFKLLMPKIKAEGMLKAYQRECQLLPILLENEQRGIRCDARLLREDLTHYETASAVAEQWIRYQLHSPNLNIDSDADLAEALDKLGLVSQWALTTTGKRSVSKKNLLRSHFSDTKLADALAYRSKLGTCMGTFMRPWLKMAEETGQVFTNWNQVRSEDSGARTGRMSSSPNFQNVPKTFDIDEPSANDYHHPAFLSVPFLPLMRRYLLPDKHELWLHRDYNQQELRILAHFEDGPLLAAYLEDSQVDIHTYVQGLIKQHTGMYLLRNSVKQVNFGVVYGMGAPGLSEKLGISLDEARTLKNAHSKALPGLVTLEKGLKEVSDSGQPICTWAGRRYYVETPKLVNGKTRHFEYKLLNYLIQGSAADCTKQALINYHAIKKHGRLLVTVHDELNVSTPSSARQEEMKLLREAMLDVSFDLPMLSDGKTGRNWGDLKAYKEPK